MLETEGYILYVWRMNLTRTISDLLYSHDCVIVPGFGAFIAQKSNSEYKPQESLLLPPSKKITFNPLLNHNDGLLINQVAKLKKLSFERAEEEVEKGVQFWNFHLVSNPKLILEGIGIFTKDEQDKLIFEPVDFNYLPEAYGLAPVKATYILPVEDKKSSSFIWWKAAAIVPILLGGFLYFSKPKPVAEFVNEQFSGIVSPMMEQMQPAQAGIATPLNEIINQIQRVKEENKVHKYQVIHGALKNMEEVSAELDKLHEKGFTDARFTQKSGNYYYVAYKTFPDFDEALEYRETLMDENPEVWILTVRDDEE